MAIMLTITVIRPNPISLTIGAITTMIAAAIFNKEVAQCSTNQAIGNLKILLFKTL